MNSSVQTLFKKLQNVVLYIFPPFISIIYLSIPKVYNQKVILTYGGFIISALLISAFGYFINDATDIKTDELAGKKNMTSGISKFQRATISLILLLIGLIIFYFSINKFIPFILLCVQIIALFLYSVPPIRLKNNPILGPLTDAHYGHIIPVFIAFSTFYELNTTNWFYFVPLYLLLLFKGLRNILLHQLDDRKTDIRSAVKTFPIVMGPVTTINLINRLFLPLEFLLISLLIGKIFPLYPIISYGFCGFLLFTFLNFSGWKFFILPRRQLRFKFLFFLNDFYELWLPMLCIWSTSISIYIQIGMTIFHLLLFSGSSKKLLKDIRKILQNFGLYKVN